MNVDGFGNVTKDQRLEVLHTLGEEQLLPLDDGGGDLHDRLRALV